MKEIPIGEEIRIRCVEGLPRDKENNPSCSGCALWDFGFCVAEKILCDSYRRSDRKNVHFELVETTEPSAPTRLTTNQKIDIVNQFYTCQDKWVAKRTIEMMEEMLNQKEKDNESK